MELIEEITHIPGWELQSRKEFPENDITELTFTNGEVSKTIVISGYELLRLRGRKGIAYLAHRKLNDG